MTIAILGAQPKNYPETKSKVFLNALRFKVKGLIKIAFIRYFNF